MQLITIDLMWNLSRTGQNASISTSARVHIDKYATVVGLVLLIREGSLTRKSRAECNTMR